MSGERDESKCRDCDKRLATQHDYDACDHDCPTCEKCESVCWSAYNLTGCAHPIDWRARATTAERERDAARDEARTLSNRFIGLRRAIKAQLDEKPTEEWEAIDLKGRISEMLSAPQGSFGDRGSLVENLVKKHVEEAMNKELKPLVEQAKKSLKDQLDAGVQAKFAEVVKQALGVKL